MKIEVFTAHGGGRYWRRLLNDWREQGHTVSEFYGFDDIAYRRSRGRVSKLWLRFQTYLIFPLRACFRLRKTDPHPDSVTVVITSPFFLPCLAAWIRGSKYRVPIVNVTNDVFPDALIQAGILKPDSKLTNHLGRITRYSCQRCDATVFLGHHLMTFAEKRYGPIRIAKVIPVGADSIFVGNTAPTTLSKTSPIGILYSGTMGHMHDTETIAELVNRGIPPRIHLVFHSSGTGYGRLIRSLPPMTGENGKYISLRGPLPDDSWRQALLDHPIALVTLKPGAQHVSMPSKTYSALAAGQAIIAICPINSDLAELVLQHDCGWVVQPGNVDELRCLLLGIAENPAILNKKRMAAYQAGRNFYDMAVISKQYLVLFEELLKRSAAETFAPQKIETHSK